MKKTLIAMTSITYAMKAKSLLNNKKIHCEIEKTPKNTSTGCGYSIRIQNDPDYIIDILDNHNIPHKEVYMI